MSRNLAFVKSRFRALCNKLTELGYKFNMLQIQLSVYNDMTLNPKSLPKGSAKLKSAVNSGNRMTADEEKAVARAYQDIKEGKVRTFKDADEFLKYLDSV